uniref:Kv channel-interacting protein 4 n=1 Tax=Magallana gigas TaxID=29159 RepID=A0A8W8ISF6_MAGGI
MNIVPAVAVGQAIKKLKLRKSSPGRARIPPRGSVRKRLQSSQSFMSTGEIDHILTEYNNAVRINTVALRSEMQESR